MTPQCRVAFCLKFLQAGLSLWSEDCYGALAEGSVFSKTCVCFLHLRAICVGTLVLISLGNSDYAWN